MECSKRRACPIKITTSQQDWYLLLNYNPLLFAWFAERILMSSQNVRVVGKYQGNWYRFAQANVFLNFTLTQKSISLEQRIFQFYRHLCSMNSLHCWIMLIIRGHMNCINKDKEIDLDIENYKYIIIINSNLY